LKSIYLGTLSFFLSALFATSVSAKLGDDESAIKNDQTPLEIKEIKFEDKGKYKVYTLVNADVWTIKEFVSPSGKVFAVSWLGTAKPDLEKLVIDSYKEQLKIACAPSARRPGHRIKSVLTDNLKVEDGGRPRNIEGRMYDTLLVPEGVSLNEIFK
jgi:hypothetical protein